MAISKVIYGNQTLIDITDTDASATTVQAGKKFYDSAGNLIIGTGSALSHETEILANGGTAHYINGIDLGSDTVDAAHLAQGYTAHDYTGTAITGTMQGGALKMGVIRPDAELVKTWSNDSLWVTDDEGTIPAYTTASTTIHTGAAITPTESLALGNYRYYVLFRCITIPIYDDTTKAKAVFDYSMTSSMYEIIEVPANSIPNLDGSLYASRNTAINNAGAYYRSVYWTSGTAWTVYTASSYGIHQTVAAPTVSSATSGTPTLTIKDPNLIIRGSTTYLNSTAWGKMTDIRRQYVIELYRVSKLNDTLPGWGMYSQFLHILDCVNSTNHKLT